MMLRAAAAGSAVLFLSPVLVLAKLSDSAGTMPAAEGGECVAPGRAGGGARPCPLVAARHGAQHSLMQQELSRKAGAPAAASERGAAVLGDPSGFEDMPPVQEAPESKGECDALLAVLATADSVRASRDLYEMVCRNAMRRRLPKLSGGCLYVPTNKHINAFYSTVESPNPWFFPSMFEDSFFKVEKGGQCPSEAKGGVATSLKGARVKSCKRESGFVGHAGVCVGVKTLGETQAEGVTVFAIDGLIGLLPVWEELVASSDPEEDKAEVSEERPANEDER